MTLLSAIFIWLLGGLFCLLLKPAQANRIGPISCAAGSIVGLMSVTASFTATPATAVISGWAMPFGELALSMDPLSSVFAVTVMLVCGLSAVYGGKYMSHTSHPEKTGWSWFLYNLLTASMFVVVTAQNAVLFLLAWEIMSLASFFLVIFDSGKPAVRYAGLTYLVATHIATFFLVVMFILFGEFTGSFDFQSFQNVPVPAEAVPVVLVLALIGFGTKAGMMPFHVWLPEAHPAAPSHVSAVMSGVMIKTGIYGILRVMSFISAPPEWWGWTLIAAGAVSGVLGILFAFAQRDLKRLLAYCSVENIGIILLGIGMGSLGATYGQPVLVIAGYTGALLHVINHAVFKGLLFLSAGSVLYSAGTAEIDHLGGLIKKMPRTGFAFLIGSIAICGLPPFNGFISELLIYIGSFKVIVSGKALPALAGVLTASALAVIGGLAVACFAKAFGIIFLGEPRTQHASDAHESGSLMTIPMLVLTVLCLIIGLSGPMIAGLLVPAVGVIIGKTGPAFTADLHTVLSSATAILSKVSLCAAGFIGIVLLLVLLRRWILSGRSVRTAVTWDCGYARSSVRMQYTASSFAQPLTTLFRFLLGTYRKMPNLKDLFPNEASFLTETPDIWRNRVYDPVFSAISDVLAKFRWIQHGRINLYVLCIVIALLVLLGWKMR